MSSREDRRRDSMPVRMALAENDLDDHDRQIGEHGDRITFLEQARRAGRTTFWSTLATVVVALIGGTAVVIAAVVGGK